MSHKFLLDASFHALLVQIDHELAAVPQHARCGCNVPLDRSDYPRSPMGLPPDLRGHYGERISFCCRVCRKRVTPPSVRFFGRRWYPAPLFLIISILTLGISERRIAQMRRHFGITVSESTWKRWRRWWRTVFITTPFWQAAKGLTAIALTSSRRILPRALLILYRGSLEEKMTRLLRFLSPLTGGNMRAA